MNFIIATVVVSAIVVPTVYGHGYIVDPPSRASRWRFGFTGPAEYTDNQLSCGGRNVQWGKHRGKCGVCGDEYGIAKPKFVYPGAFARNPPIVKMYTEGQNIDVRVKITANHKGYFTFRVAPLIKAPIKQKDLDKIMLEMENGDAEWKLLSSHGNAVFTITLKLPMGLTCEHCVLQWWWTTGNNHVNNRPETFVNCADIEIRSRHGPRPTINPKPRPTKRPTKSPPRPKPSTKPPRPGGNECKSHGVMTSPAMDGWCRQNCARGHCPDYYCICT